MEKDEGYKTIAKCFDLWMEERENANFINQYLEKENVKKIGIYGYGMLGRHLLYELQSSSIEIAWIMDKRGESISCAYPVLMPDEIGNTAKVDIVIVTAVGDFAEIEKMFCERVSYPVISLLEIIEEMGYFRRKV